MKVVGTMQINVSKLMVLMLSSIKCILALTLILIFRMHKTKMFAEVIGLKK